MAVTRSRLMVLVVVTCTVGCANTARREFTDPATRLGIAVSATGSPGHVEVRANVDDPTRSASIGGVVLRIPGGQALTPRRVRVEMDERRVTDHLGGGFGYGRDPRDPLARRRGGRHQPRTVSDGDDGPAPRRVRRHLSEAVLITRAHTDTGIDRVKTVFPVPTDTSSFKHYAVGVLVFCGRRRTPLAVVVPLDDDAPVRRLRRQILSPTQLALEMELGYVSDFPGRRGPARWGAGTGRRRAH